MFKFVLVSAVLVASLKGAYSGHLGGHESLSLGSYGGGDDSYGAVSVGGGGYGGFDSGAALAGADAGGHGGAILQQSGGSGGGDFHGGVSVVGGSSQQGQTLDLTGGDSHGHKVYGGSFISAGVSGKSGSYGEEGGDGGYEGLSLGGHEGLGSYSGASSYDVGGHGGEITGVLSASVKAEPDEAFYHH